MIKVGDKVVVNNLKANCRSCGVVLKITSKRIKVRTNFAPEENLKKHYGNRMKVFQYYKPINVTRKEWS